MGRCARHGRSLSGEESTTMAETASDVGTVAQVADALVAWLRREAQERGAKALVVGLSGGIDSAVTAGLCARAMPGAVYTLLLPMHSAPADAADAQAVAERFGLPWRRVDLSDVYDRFLDALGADIAAVRAVQVNLRPRLRMAALYAEAAHREGLVVGTSNRDELELGYFTKFGDGGCDLEPIGSLDKSEVRALAAYLGVPDAVIRRAPSAGLWEGQTDEGEFGFTYEALDRYRRTGEGDPELVRKVAILRANARHKLEPPPVAPHP